MSPRGGAPEGPQGGARPGGLASRLPARLFWRVYLNGLLLLFLVALATGATGALLGRGPGGRNPERFAEYAAARADELRREPAALDRELRRLHDAFGTSVTLYEGGRVLATNVDPPLEPVGPEDEAFRRGGARRLHGHRFRFAAPLAPAPGAAPGYVVLGWAVASPSLLRGAAFLAAVLLALALASIPLARAIASPLERLGRAVRAFGAGDLSARARLAAGGEVGEVASAFDAMADRIQALLRTEKELLANVSHELRTPLTRIRVALELAAEGDLEAARRHLGGIAADLDELERLVDDVLTAARLDLAGGRGAAAELPLRRERLDARELLLRSAERFRAAYPRHPLEEELAPALPSVDGDPALLRRALDNLLENAAKYSDEGSPVLLAASAAGGALRVVVRDRGIGLDPEDLARLFTPFFRSDRSRARGTGGVGLGLALARRIVEAHGGHIEAASQPGQGTTFTVELPGAPPAPSGEGARASDSGPGP